MVEPLYTSKETAKLLRCSVKTLPAIVRSGALSYVQIGAGTIKPHRMFTGAAIADYIEHHTHTDTPSCQSIGRRVRRTSNMTSNYEVTGFTELRNKLADARPKRRNE